MAFEAPWAQTRPRFDHLSNLRPYPLALARLRAARSTRPANPLNFLAIIKYAFIVICYDE